MKCFLGIDTSNYTTSLALADEQSKLLSRRKLLQVAEGERGLRQSEALFQHVKALPVLARELTQKTDIAAVGVSGFPRRCEGSYMPCFLAGVSVAASTAAFFGVPLYVFSHQEGHLAAAKYGSGMPDEKSFYAFHMSGGTFELLKADYENGNYNIEPVSDSADLTAGQLIDRCGVRLGLKFPCGAELEKLAMAADRHFKVRIAQKDSRISISGLENRFEKMLIEGESKENCAGFVFDAVIAAARQMIQTIEPLPLLFMGGVSSSKLLKAAFADRAGCYFASGEYSCDNAIGTALLAKHAFELGKEADSLGRLRLE